MWAASLISGQPWASIAIPSAPAPQMCLPIPMFRWRSRPKDHDTKKDIEPTQSQKSSGAVGQAVLAAAFTSKPEQPPSHIRDRVLKPQRESQTKASPQQEGRQLSGSDVLRALQRASVEKAKLSLKQKKKSNKKRDVLTSRGGGQLALDDYTNSRTIPSLSIKSDWGVRLEELEKRLEEIMLLD